MEDLQRAPALEQIDLVSDFVSPDSRRMPAPQRWEQPTRGIVIHSGSPRSVRETRSNQYPITTLSENRKSQIGRLHLRIMLEKEASRAYALPADHLLSLVY